MSKNYIHTPLSDVMVIDKIRSCKSNMSMWTCNSHREFIAPPLSQLGEYNPINPIYMINGCISPLQKWMDSIIDFSQITVISNAHLVERYEGKFVALDILPIIHLEWTVDCDLPEMKCQVIVDDLIKYWRMYKEGVQKSTVLD